jgi:hypothetical protein
MKPINKTILIILIISVCFFFGFYFGRKVKKVEAQLGAECPNTVNQALLSKCNCPTKDTIYQVGCTQGVSGVDVVEIKGAKNVILSNKKYLITNITSSDVPFTIAKEQIEP